MPSDDEETRALLSASRRADQQGGNPLFQIRPERIGNPRVFRNGAAAQHAVRFRLEQLRAPNGEFQGEAVAEALRQGLAEYLRENQIGPVEDYSLWMPIHHSTGTHTWTSCPALPLTEWLEGSEMSNARIDKLAKQLNNSESFDATSGEFYAELLFFRNRGRGSGCRGREGNPGNMSYEQMLKKKKCIVTIKNEDELCAVRAIVTMTALADDDPKYEDFRRGRWRQGQLAKDLHREAGVPEGPCGLEHIKKFQTHLAPTYQVIVIEGLQGLLWYKDRAFDGAPKKIVLLKVENHFHGLRSVPVLLNRSYYCFHFEKTYDSETSEKHNCVGQNCKACKRTNKTCPNFATFVTPEVYCSDCDRFFYGQNCFEAHKQRKKDKRGKEALPSICRQVKQCPECCKELKPSKKKKHVCYEYHCRNCNETVLGDHQCYIQPIVEKEKKSGLRMVEENKDEELMLEMEEEENGEENDGEESKKVEPLKCVIDFECSKGHNKAFEEIRVGWRYIGEEGSFREAETALEMLQVVMAKTVTEDGKERRVFVFAHNMRGFDSSFILNVLYVMGYKIVKVLSMGQNFCRLSVVICCLEIL